MFLLLLHSSLPHTTGILKPQYIFVCQRYPQLSWKTQLFLSKIERNNCKMRETSKPLPVAYDFSRLCPVKALSGDPRRLKLHWWILPCPTTSAQALLVTIEQLFSGLGNFHSNLGETFISADLELLITAVNREPTIIIPLLVSLPQFSLTVFASTPVSQT